MSLSPDMRMILLSLRDMRQVLDVDGTEMRSARGLARRGLVTCKEVPFGVKIKLTPEGVEVRRRLLQEKQS